MVSLETQTEPQEVPQLVVAGEVDDCGRHRHNPTQTHKMCWDSSVQAVFFIILFDIRHLDLDI